MLQRGEDKIKAKALKIEPLDVCILGSILLAGVGFWMVEPWLGFAVPGFLLYMAAIITIAIGD